jgi:diguanylate cyclase (GGDEF)-like protein
VQCERAQELISARIDREIIFDDAALEEHLAACVACRQELEGMRRVDGLLHAAYEPERDAAALLGDTVKAALQARGRHVQRCTVLVVDDHPDLRQSIRCWLVNEFNVVLAANAREAQQVFLERAIDIVLTDQRIEGITGVDLLEWAVDRYPRTQRLLMTSHDELDAAVNAVNRGHVFRFLMKPDLGDKLLHAVRAAARACQVERDYERVLRELSEVNVQLEERVRERTRQLQEANRELEQRTQILEKFALTDALTMLPNRRALDHFVERELHLCRRFPAPLAVALIDVDHFKEINTKHFHPGGDQVLRDLARCMTGSLRKIDMVGRMGAGDEFLLIAPHTHRPGALALAERLRARVQNHTFTYKGQRVPVTVTIGLAVVETGRTPEYEQVQLAAAAALALAKASGRNCVEIAAVASSAGEDTVGEQGNTASA